MVPRENAPLWECFLFVGECIKKVLLSEKYIISMYDFLVQYVQVESNEAFRYCNFPHDCIKDKISGMKIERFPMMCYQEEYTIRGMVLWVRDRSGKTLPYINPLLLGNISAEEIIARLVRGMDVGLLLEIMLQRTEFSVVPVDQISEERGYTRKKSYQKKFDQKRKEWFE